MNHSTNASAIQSKQWICEALLNLMETNTFASITISEITNQAQLSRRTFYRNFESKEDVIQYFLKQLVEEYKRRLLSYETYTLEFSIEQLLILCQEYKQALFSLKQNHMLGILLESWTEFLPQVHAAVIEHMENFPGFDDKQALDYLLAFNVGGIFNIMIKWINDGMILKPKEVSHMLFQYPCQLSR